MKEKLKEIFLFLIIIIIIVILWILSSVVKQSTGNKISLEENEEQITKTLTNEKIENKPDDLYKEKNGELTQFKRDYYEYYIAFIKSQILIGEDAFETTREEREGIIRQKLTEIKAYDNKDYGIIYKSFADGFEYSQNKDEIFIAASTVKIAYSMIMEERVKDDKINLDKTFLTYKKEDYQRGGGDITLGIDSGKYKENDKFTLREILYQMIVNSDNTAKDMLISNYPDIQDEMLKYSLKGKYYKDNNTISLQFLSDILNILYYSDKYPYTLDLMKETIDYWNVCNTDVVFAKKYGWYSDTISEIGIVYDERPYMIIIFNSGIYTPPPDFSNTSLNKIGEIFLYINNLP